MPQRLVIAGAHPRLNLNSTDALNAEVANSRNLHILSIPEPIFQMNRNTTIAEVEFWKGEECTYIFVNKVSLSWKSWWQTFKTQESKFEFEKLVANL